MQNIVAQGGRLLLGKDLPTLAKKLKKTDAHVSWLLGLNIGRWYVITADGSRKKRNKTMPSSGEQGGDLPLIPRHSIMARFLMSNPEYAQPPSFHDLLEELSAIDPSIDHRKLAIILGLEPTAGDRMIQSSGKSLVGGTKLSPTAANMINLIYTNLKFAADLDQKKDLLRKLIDNVNQEAAARGIPFGKIWEKGGWTRLATRPELMSTVKSAKSEEIE